MSIIRQLEIGKTTNIVRRLVAAVTVLLSLAPALALAIDAEQHNGDSLTLVVAIEKAVRGNPGLAETRARYQAMKEIPSQRGTLPDPILSLSAMNLPSDTFHLGQEAMTQMQIGLSQALPFPGKLALRRQASEYDAQAAHHLVEETRLKLVSGVKRVWWQIFYLDRALAIVDVNRALLRNFVKVAKVKYEVASGLQQDVLLAQLEVSKIIDQKLQLQAIRQNQASQLNLLMDMPVNTSIVLPERVAEEMPVIAAEMELNRRALKHRPLLKKMARHVDAAHTRLKLAEKDYYPDFKLGVAYGARSGDNPSARGGSRTDLLSVMFSVNLPVHTANRQSKAVSQHTQEVIKNRYALKDQSGLVSADIYQSSTDYRRAKQQISLFKTGIIPQAQQTVASMLAGYQVGEVDFLNLVRSQVTLFNYQLRYWQALMEANQALARLAAATGEENIYE